MSTARATLPRRARRGWTLAVAGLSLLILSVVMMASGAPPSRAQTVQSFRAASREATVVPHDPAPSTAMRMPTTVR